MENEQLKQELRNLAAETLQVPLEQIPEDLAFGDLPQWDSLGHMDLMLALEARFGVQINTETISNLVSLPAIYAYLDGNSTPGKEDEHA